MATDKQLYNEDIKEEFLSQYSGATAKQYRYCLYRAFETEDMLNRDLYTFNTNEIKDALTNANHISFNSINLTFSVFRVYLEWAASKGYSYSNINVIEPITREELEKLVQEREFYISIDGLREIGSKIENAQDLVCLWLPFEGISGYKASEMTNLMYKHVGWNTNELSLKDDKYGIRNVNVSEECLTIIRSAYQEEKYRSISEKERNLIRNDFIIRNTEGKRTSYTERVSEHTIYRRISNMREILNTPILNIKLVERSGMIHMAYKLFKEHGELTREHYGRIAKQFGISPIKFDGKEDYNYSLLYRFINRDTILDLYGIDIEAE